MRRFWRVARFVAVVAFFLLTAYTGFVDGVDTFRSSATRGQKAAAVCQLLYGALAATSLLALLLLRRWAMPLVIAWGVVLAVTGGLAAVVWGEQGVLVGVFAGLCTAGGAALVVWGCRRHNVDTLMRNRVAAA